MIAYFQNSGNAQGKQLWRIFGVAVLLFAIPFTDCQTTRFGHGFVGGGSGYLRYLFCRIGAGVVIIGLTGTVVIGVVALYEMLKNDVAIIE